MRWLNPTAYQLEQKLAALEGAEACVAFGSGMAAITALFLYHLSSGDRLVISDVAYAGAVELAQDLLPRMGVDVARVNMLTFPKSNRRLHLEQVSYSSKPLAILSSG